MSQKAFKPVFDGYFKIFLHDDDYKKAADRAEFINNSHEWQYQDEMLWEVRIYD